MVLRLSLAMLFAATLVLAPVAQAAAPETPTRAALQRLDNWTAGFQQTHSSVSMGASVSSTHVVLSPLGDADGDGHGDLAVMRLSFESDHGDFELESAVSALSGADLATTLWQHVPAKGAIAFPAVDADGDQVQDLIMAAIPEEPVYAEVSAPIPFAHAGDFAFSFAQDATVASGRDLQELARLSGAFHAKGQGVAAFPLLGSAGAYKEDMLSQFSDILAAGSLVATEFQLNSTSAFASAAAGAGGGQYDQDLTVTLQGLDGSAVATVVRDSPDLIAIDFQALGSAGASAVAVLEAKPAAPASVMLGAALPFIATPGPSPVLAVHDGETGELLWETVRDPVDLDAGILPSPGDMDGDGHHEVVLFEAWTDVTEGPFSAPRLRTTLFSGADGTVLGALESTEAMSAFLPFGDADGDGSAEALRLDFSFEHEFSVSLVGADLEPVWTIDAMDTYPLNMVMDAYRQMPAGFSDLTGDGVPDLALVVFPEEEDSEEGARTLVADMPIRLLDGVDGKAVWQRTFAGLVDARLVPDLSGLGGGDLLLVRLEGFEGPDAVLEDATLLYESIRGETGSLLRSQVLHSPALDPLGSGILQAYGGPLGDLDGDGTEDIGVNVRVSHESSVASMGGSMERTISTKESWMLFSGATGQALGGFTNEGDIDQVAAAVPIVVLPASDAVVQESSAAPLALVLVAFLAAGLRSRSAK